jgi:hypothetical protein
MIVDRNQYLVLWPSLKMYGLEKGEICKKLYGKTDFTIYSKFSVKKLDTYNNEPIVIFWKIPFVCSVSIDPHSYTDSNNETINSHLLFTNYTLKVDDKDDIKRTGIYFDFNFDVEYEISIVYSASDSVIKYYLNNELKFEVIIDSEFFNDYDNPQILLGRNQFDKETTYDVDFKFLILSENILDFSNIENIKEEYLIKSDEYGEYSDSKKYGVLGLYDFKKFNRFKIFDYTGNNNHIYIQTIKNE